MHVQLKSSITHLTNTQQSHGHTENSPLHCMHCLNAPIQESFGPYMVEVDSSNLTQLDPPILNVLAATQYSQNRQAKGRVDVFNYATQELSSLVTSGLSFTSV